MVFTPQVKNEEYQLKCSDYDEHSEIAIADGGASYPYGRGLFAQL
jgi:hypothetical protein